MSDTQRSDAAPPPQSPPTIWRKDYSAPKWLVAEIALDFNLGLDITVVKATLSIQRNGDHDAPLRLDVDEIIPDRATLNGDPINWREDNGQIVFDVSVNSAFLEVTCTLNPDKNTKLMGLYASNGMLCTQCEAEGFRRIVPFVDRPDNLSVYTVRMEGEKAAFPVLLSNGACTGQGDLDERRHFAVWHDPHPKPSYLFALVAGDLVANRDTFTTMNGNNVDLAIYVREGDQDRTHHAMKALKDSMLWDEKTYGREYDLPVFNIVAVSDFNMGAMENKGLNVFNSRYILADPDTATDNDYDAIEGVVAHEYFHNWSGNRVTCRDWFQLSLKEGFTVFRDQSFSADMGSAPVKRIEDVRILRAAQFPEDAGPLAHPIRPDSYMEISNFYTATVYNKGAEIIRMMATLAGRDKFRSGTDLYFDRHDGQAATCEDFVAAIEDGAGLDLGQFRRWYEQAGTPQIAASITHDSDAAKVELTLRQTLPVTPGQVDKLPMVIPLKTAFLDRKSGDHTGEHLLLLNQSEQTFTFTGFEASPILSINRGFSAPVTMDVQRNAGDLVFLARHDDDPFARYEAIQQLAIDRLMADIDDADSNSAPALDEIIAVFSDVLTDNSLDDSMRAEMLILPSEAFLGEQMLVVRPDAIHSARKAMRKAIGESLSAQWRDAHQAARAVPYSLDADARGARKMKTLALGYIAASQADDAAAIAFDQFGAADNMTDRQGALAILASTSSDQRETALDSFYNRYAGNALVIDKWFSLQTGSLHPQVYAHVLELARHKDFTLSNPNRVRALYWPFVANQAAFHHESGRGYALLADLVGALDPLNPQTAARFIAPLGRWRRFDEARAVKMREALGKILEQPNLSRDTTEQASKSLG